MLQSVNLLWLGLSLCSEWLKIGLGLGGFVEFLCNSFCWWARMRFFILTKRRAPCFSLTSDFILSTDASITSWLSWLYSPCPDRQAPISRPWNLSFLLVFSATSHNSQHFNSLLKSTQLLFYNVCTSWLFAWQKSTMFARTSSTVNGLPPPT